MDRLQQVCAAATAAAADAAEAASAAEVDQLDDPCGHQHDVVPLQVAVNHLAQVEVGHALHDLLGVQSQDALWQRTKPTLSR